MSDDVETKKAPRRAVAHKSQFKPAKPPRKEEIVVPEIQVDDGQGGEADAVFYMFQLTAGAIRKHQKYLTEDGEHGWQYSLIAQSCRTAQGHPIWKTPKEVAESLDQFPNSAVVKLLEGYDKASGPAEEVVEGNFEGTPTGSSPSE